MIGFALNSVKTCKASSKSVHSVEWSKFQINWVLLLPNFLRWARILEYVVVQALFSGKLIDYHSSALVFARKFLRFAATPPNNRRLSDYKQTWITPR